MKEKQCIYWNFHNANRTKAIDERYPYFEETMLRNIPLFLLVNGAGIGCFSMRSQGAKGMIVGTIFGFSSIYLIFYYSIEASLFHLTAMSEKKFSYYLREQYIKEFPNSYKSTMYINFDKELTKKYDITKNYIFVR